MTMGTVCGNVSDARPIRRLREPGCMTITFDPPWSGSSSSESGDSVSCGASFAAASLASASFASDAISRFVYISHKRLSGGLNLIILFKVVCVIVFLIDVGYNGDRGKSHCIVITFK